MERLDSLQRGRGRGRTRVRMLSMRGGHDGRRRDVLRGRYRRNVLRVAVLSSGLRGRGVSQKRLRRGLTTYRLRVTRLEGVGRVLNRRLIVCGLYSKLAFSPQGRVLSYTKGQVGLSTRNDQLLLLFLRTSRGGLSCRRLLRVV